MSVPIRGNSRKVAHPHMDGLVPAGLMWPWSTLRPRIRTAHSLRLKVMHKIEDKAWVGDETCVSLMGMRRIFYEAKGNLLDKGKDPADYKFIAVIFPDVAG